MATSPDKLIVVLIGRTGSGKSATGNTILGSKSFDASRSAVSQTINTKWGKRRNGREIVVIDTPGVFDTRKHISKEVISKEIGKCLGMALCHGKGIDAFVLVLNLDDRFTEEHVQSVEIFKKIFGDEMMKYVTIVFTRKDQLDEDQTLADFLKNVPDDLDKLLHRCDHRVVAFNNKEKDAKEKKSQFDELVVVISDMKKKNGNRPFTNPVTEKIKKIVSKDTENYDGPDAVDKQCDAFSNESSSTLGVIADTVLNVLTLGLYGWLKK